MEEALKMRRRKSVKPLEPTLTPLEHCGCFSCGDFDGPPPLLPLKNLSSELEANYTQTDSARPDPVLSVSSPSLEDDFSGFLAL